MHECSVKEIVKDLDENFGPVLRSGKIRKDKCHSRDKWMSYQRCAPYETRCVSRLVEMECCIASNIMKMMVPHECHA